MRAIRLEISKLTDANCKIETFLDEVDVGIVKAEVDGDVGISDQIIGDRGSKMAHAEGYRRSHSQLAARRRLQIARSAFGFIEIGENAQATFIIILPDLGGADAAGRSIEQPYAEPLFKCLNVLAHHGGRHAKVTGRRRKAAGVDDFNEHGHSSEPIQALPHSFTTQQASPR